MLLLSLSKVLNKKQKHSTLPINIFAQNFPKAAGSYEFVAFDPLKLLVKQGRLLISQLLTLVLNCTNRSVRTLVHTAGSADCVTTAATKTRNVASLSPSALECVFLCLFLFFCSFVCFLFYLSYLLL